MVKRYGGPTPGERVAGYVRRYGIDVDPERLEDRAAALRSRQRSTMTLTYSGFRLPHLPPKKARRNCELAEMDWRMNPNADTLAAALAAQQVRNTADRDLRELCVNDEETIAAVLLRWGR